MDIKSLAEQYNDYIIDRRRYYHTCPELSGEEKNTRAHLKEDLEALGITDIHEMETCYGLTATIHGGKPGKTVALRADIDALPVKEETGLPFASHNEGKMHACGHDNHMAMLLGAAKILNEHKEELQGTVRNVIDFGVFVDIGVHQDGLVHISQLADRYVASPADVVHLGQHVEVRVTGVDAVRGRIALSMRREA